MEDGGNCTYLAQLQVVTRDILPKGLKFRFRSTEFPFWSIHLPKMLTRSFFWVVGGSCWDARTF